MQPYNMFKINLKVGLRAIWMSLKLNLWEIWAVNFQVFPYIVTQNMVILDL